MGVLWTAACLFICSFWRSSLTQDLRSWHPWLSPMQFPISMVAFATGTHLKNATEPERIGRLVKSDLKSLHMIIWIFQISYFDLYLVFMYKLRNLSLNLILGLFEGKQLLDNPTWFLPTTISWGVLFSNCTIDGTLYFSKSMSSESLEVYWIDIMLLVWINLTNYSLLFSTQHGTTFIP